MPGEEALGGSEAVSAWASAGDPATPARPGSLSLLVAEARRFVGESGEGRWEGSGAARPWRGGRTQVRGRGSSFCVYVLGSLGRPVLPGGCALWLSGPNSAPLSSSPFPRRVYSCHTVGFLQPRPLVQLRHRLPGPSARATARGEPACSLRAAPSWLLPPRVLGGGFRVSSR